MNLKETIIHESLRLFSLKGFLSTSLHDILEAAHSSKGGFYNHFGSKEDLFLAVLSKAQRIWRERNLTGLDAVEGPINKIKKLLENYRDKYLKDAENFPGGCIFVTLSVELDDQRPHLSQEINKGFAGFREMLKRLLDQGKESGELKQEEDTGALAEMIFSGMLGASVLYGTQKSATSLDQSLNSLIACLERLEAGKTQCVFK